MSTNDTIKVAAPEPTAVAAAQPGPAALDHALAAHLPQPVVEKLQLTIRRLRRIIWFRGGLMVAGVLIGLLLAIMAVDAAVVLLSQPARVALSCGALLAVAAVAYAVLVRPLLRKYTLTGMARLLDLRHPELQERMSSALDLTGSSIPAELKGSEILIGELVKAAEVDARALAPRREFTMRTVKPYLVTAAILTAVLLLLFLLWPGSVARLLARALVPYANIGNAYASALTVVPGQARVAFGDRLTITVRTETRGLRRVEVRRLEARGSEIVERMAPVPTSAPEGPTQFSMTFPAVTESFQYRVRAGTALSPYYEIRVERRPEVEQFKVGFAYPAYTRLAPVVEQRPPGDIEGPVGARVTLSARLSKPVTVAELLVNGQPVAGRKDSGPADRPLTEWSLPLTQGLSGTWAFRLVDDLGLTNLPAEYKLLAIPDAAPAVQIMEPAATKLKLKPTERLTLTYVARDDYGIGSATLLVTIDQGRTTNRVLQVPVKQPGKLGQYVGQAQLDLAGLDLAQARNVSLKIGVTDVLPPELHGPQAGFSEVVSIELDRRAPSLGRQTVAQQEAQLRAELAAVKAQLEQAKARADAKDAPQAEGRPTAADLKEVDRLAAKAEDALHQLAEQARETPFAPLARPLNDVADKFVAPARQAAEASQLADNPQAKNENVKNMRADLAQAVAALDEVAKGLDKAKAAAQVLADLKDLANREDQLAQAAQGLAEKAPAPEPQTAEWRKSQEELVKNLAEMAQSNAAQMPAAAQPNAEAQKQLGEKLEAGNQPDQAGQAQELAGQEQAVGNELAAMKQGDLQKALAEMQQAQSQQSKSGQGNKPGQGDKPGPSPGSQAGQSQAPTPGAQPGPGQSPAPGSQPGQGQTPGAQPGQGGPPMDQGALAQAMDKASAAASAPAMPAAAQAAGQAAQQLNQLASATAQKMGMSPGSLPGQPGGKMKGRAGGQGLNQGGAGEVAPADAPDAGLPAGSAAGGWLKAKGTLSGQVKDAGDDGTPVDYRDLVKRYFRAVSTKDNKQE